MTTLDPRIGILNRNGQTIYYACIDNSKWVERTTVKGIMAVLRGGPSKEPTLKPYVVMAKVKYPAWDETNGWVGEVKAYNARHAAKIYRERMSNVVDRHSGALTITAKKVC